MISSSTSDVRLALRSLARSPLFATVAILSLARESAQIRRSSLIDQIVLRKLPVQKPEELVMLLAGGGGDSNMGTRMHLSDVSDFQKKPNRWPTCCAGVSSPRR